MRSRVLFVTVDIPLRFRLRTLHFGVAYSGKVTLKMKGQTKLINDEIAMQTGGLSVQSCAVISAS